MRRIATFIFLLACSFSYGQGYNHQWLLGYDTGLFDTNVTSTKAWLQFDSNSVIVTPDNFKMPFRAAQANISDENGNLLMVTNGYWIADIRSYVANRGRTKDIKDVLYPGRFDVLYNFDDENSLSINLTQARINGYIRYLNNNPDFNLILEGNTSTERSDDYNFILGQRRANDIADRVVQGGIPSERLCTDSKGEKNPKISPDDTETKRGQNRRVSIINEPAR